LKVQKFRRTLRGYFYVKEEQVTDEEIIQAVQEYLN
jgi:hypothetical protein